MVYDVKSAKAEEFICHEEILDSLAYAEANKGNLQLIDEIIEKARQRKGLLHREALLLLDCERNCGRAVPFAGKRFHYSERRSDRLCVFPDAK